MNENTNNAEVKNENGNGVSVFSEDGLGKRVFLEAGQLESALAQIHQKGFDVTVRTELRDGYIYVTVPYNERSDGQTKTLAMGIGQIPSAKLILSEKRKEVQDWIVYTLQTALADKLASALKSGSALPETIDEFISRSGGGRTATKGFRISAKAIVDVLKDKGLQDITVGLLQEILRSSAFAQLRYPSIPQETWVSIIDAMISKAEEVGNAALDLKEWKEKRDEAPETQEITLDGIGDLL